MISPPGNNAPDLLQPLEVIAHLHVETVGNDLRATTILVVLLPVQEPVGDLELTRVVDDDHEVLKLLGGELAGPGTRLRKGKPRLLAQGKDAYRLLRSTSAFLHTMLAKRRPTPLMEVIAYMIFCLPSTFVFITRIMCWKLSPETSDCKQYTQSSTKHQPHTPMIEQVRIKKEKSTHK
jgi:hypothetical protein